MIAVRRAIVSGIKWSFDLMARPWTEMPLKGAAQPFDGLKSTVEGLSRNERRLLLPVIENTEIFHFLFII